MRRVAIILMSICLLATPVMAGEAAPQPQMPESMEELWAMYLDLLERVETLERTVAKLTGTGLLEKADDREEETEAPPTTASAETEAPAEEPVTYRAGVYIVGSTIPAGEYVCYPTNPDRSLYVKICTDANGKNIVYNELIEGPFIATVYDGEFFTIERGYATPFPGDKPIDVTSSSFVAKVGVHIEPGLYLATTLSDERSGYYCIYSDSRYKNIIANDLFDNMTYFTVTEGQYLKIDRCTIVKQ